MTPESSGTVRAPLVSVLMTLYGRGDLAARAIETLRAHTDVDLELVVVDNDSPDDAADHLEALVPDVVVVRNRRNAGFAAGMNRAALAARGEFLLLLNGDVELTDDWLPPLLEQLERSDAVAAVVPAYTDPDGTVREVGSTLYRSGITEALHPSGSWELRRPRCVPYASAACLLVRRTDFHAVGGLDSAYDRAYYEDVELALDLRRRGRASSCVPTSRVVHHRGGSSNPDEVTALLEANRRVFVDRWPLDVAAAPPWIATRMRQERARDSAAPERVLALAVHLPDPASRLARLLAALAGRFVDTPFTVLATDLGHADEADRSARWLVERGVEVADWRDGDALAWLACRPGHYSAVVHDRSAGLDRLLDLVATGQRQARRVVDVGDSPPDQAVPAADVVVCAARDAMGTGRADVPVIVVPTPADDGTAVDDGAGLDDLMAQLGVLRS